MGERRKQPDLPADVERWIRALGPEDEERCYGRAVEDEEEDRER